MKKRKLLRTALLQERFDLAAHALVYGMLREKVKESQNGKERRTQRQPERP